MTDVARPAEAPPRDAFGLHLVFLLVIQVLWGFNWLFAKWALAEIPPMTLTTLRFLVLTAIFAPFMRWHPGQMRPVAIAALTSGALSFGFGFLALSLARDIGPLAIVANLGVPFATILSAVFLGDRIGIWRGSALVLAFLGLVVMSFDPRVLGYLDAVLLNIVSAFAWAVGAIYMRKTSHIPPLDMQGWIALGAWPPILAAALLFEPQGHSAIQGASPGAWLSLAYIILATSVIGHVGFNWLLHRQPIPRLAPFMLIAPVVAMLCGWAFLGDVLTWRILLGGALTLAGVLIITIREGARRRP